MTDRILTDADIVKRLRNIVEEPERWDSTDVEYVDDAADAIERLTAERDEARQQVARCKTIIDDYIREIAKQKVAIIEAMRMINNLNDIVRNLQKGRPT
jgi:Mg2+ and Co2+ transporter CorA